MADTTIQPGFDIANRSKNYNTTTDFDPTVNRWGEKEKYDELTRDRSTLSFTDMLGLMVTQFQNQTMDNQASTTDMMNQLVQMTTMQAMNEMTTQMEELTLANVMSYSASLVDKYVTLGVYDDEGELQEIYGKVEGAGTYDGQQVIFVGGKSYLLSSIMAVGKLPEKEETPDQGEGDGDGTGGTEGTPGTGDSENNVEKPPETEGSGDAGDNQNDGAVG